VKQYCENLFALETYAIELAAQFKQAVVYLHGDLGAGKTTLVRAWLRALGYEGTVKSPTYGLIETYQIEGVAIAHLDLYRLSDPEELEFLGIRDLSAETDLMLIEWPEKGHGLLPKSDLEILLEYAGDGRDISIKLTHKETE